ncbi:uncharacterized protein EI97DRAFT_451810 [Westerdykella ornata]|uniref:Uncharacterized protein n=1 Tax=Westerdykella ornata TaxID=318751 RepID=A0A6A6JDD5_WESOR|nr:uncharacterized protein EI97DRAFT_451810 [Westerdykella ornata]KAF2274244.1 hypothetical protein EI97DRAFT_451810 [Westerdykella ornata]
MHMEDRQRFLHFPTPVIDSCRMTIQSVWTRGIQAEREYAGSHEIKVNGYPWRGSGHSAIEARRLICGVLGALHGHGWVLMMSTDVSKKTADKDTLLFRHQIPTPAPCDWCCIGFSMWDRIEFIDVPSEVYNGLISRLGNRVSDHYQHSPGVYEAKIVGRPWIAEGTETMKARELLLVFLEVLETEGWTVYASVDQKNGGDKQTETDTWHCCRLKGWVRGAPVYHNH